MLAGNVNAGYDDNLVAGSGTGAGPGTSPNAMASGSNQSLDTTLSYFRGNAARSIRAESTGNLRAYPGNLKRPIAAGVANIDARTPLGQGLTLGVSERAGYEPFLNVLDPGAGAAPMPPGMGQVAPTAGLLERHSWNSTTSASLERQWSGRDATSISYAYHLQQFTDGERGNTHSHVVRAEYRRRVTGALTARGAYGYDNTLYRDYVGTVRPNREHRLEAGPEFEKTFSRTRQMRISFSAGVSRAETVAPAGHQPYRAWVPIGSANATLGLTSLWSIEGSYQRTFSLLQGLTDEVYTTDSASLASRLMITNRTDVRVAGTFSNWRTTFVPGLDGRLNVYGASVQVTRAVTRTIAATAGYFYYQHHFTNPAQLPVGFPPVYDRQSIRVGLTVRVPLAGAPTQSSLMPR